MEFVMRSEQQGDRLLSRQAPKLGKRFRMFSDFRLVPFAKFGPALDIVGEPFAECRAGRQVLEPTVDRSILLPQSPWPKPIDQDARSVTARGGLVDALQLDS
jgi:hypothetical protein